MAIELGFYEESADGARYRLEKVSSVTDIVEMMPGNGNITLSVEHGRHALYAQPVMYVIKGSSGVRVPFCRLEMLLKGEEIFPDSKPVGRELAERMRETARNYTQ